MSLQQVVVVVDVDAVDLAVAVAVGVRVDRRRASAAPGGFSAPTIGDFERLVKRLPKRDERTRTASRVGIGVPFLTTSIFSRRLGSVTFSSLVVPFSALTNTAFAPLRLKATVFLLMPRRKWRPWIVSVSPTNDVLGRDAL